MSKSIAQPEVKYTQLFIDNEFVNSISGKTFPTINPSTGEKICDVQEADKVDVDIAVRAARKAFQLGSPWRNMDPSAKGKLLYKLADLIEQEKEYLAALESLDNGMRYFDALEQAEEGSNILRYFAGFADKINGQTIPVDGPYLSYTRIEPIGVCGATISWNFPLGITFWKISQALACGNTVILKPSEETPLTALYLASLVLEAGFPPGVVNVLPGYGSTAGAAIAEHMDVDKLFFTGTIEVGRKVKIASAMSNLKQVALEQGGKSPIIIFADTRDLDEAVFMGHDGLFFNTGMICSAASRTFVQEEIYDEFVKRSIEKAKARSIGNPLVNTDAESGPQINKRQFDNVMELIESGKKEGAKLGCGGCRHGESGYFVQPTVFYDVTDDMRIAQEEIFGPVQCILKFKSSDEVIERANNTKYGLAAAVFTKDIDKAIKVSNSIDAGTVWVNTYSIIHFGAPFGGTKMSGDSRDLGECGLREYTKTKTVTVKLSQDC
ncbi:aldehyde dehydrogenase 1A1-like [Ptychodera flava]|uniref:aldehyde dehydrogenase 1A1-like n=1 Tax=Ptychodera flava TaxID=63121 RepID=UPI00396A34A0